MTVSTTHIESEKQVVGQQAPISKEDFLREYSDKEDGCKYEWNNGLIEKTTAMNQYQSQIFFILNRIFYSTKAFSDGGGIICETNMDTSSSQLRRPDIAFYSAEQIAQFSTGENQVATWVAEVISDNDNINKVNGKLAEYFKAGVEVVWHIFPVSKQVHVYTAVDKVTICMGETVCSGAPAIEGFEIPAEDLF